MDFNQVLELIKTVSDSELTAFQYEEGNQRILMHTGSVVWNTMMPDMGLKASANSVISAGEAGDGAGMAGGRTAEAEKKEGGPQSGSRSNASGQDALSGNLVKSPLVGRFYVAPSEDAEPFVKVGDRVKKGQVLAIVEAMKLMNEIECEYDGVVAEVLVSDSEAVEYGQPLFRIA